MRPRDVTYSSNPDMDPGLYALRAQIDGGGGGAPDEVLGLVTALEELEAVCDGVLSGRGGPYRRNRVLLRQDLERALRAIGPNVRRASGAVLASFLRELGQLETRLASPQGTRVVALALWPLLERVSDDEVLRAAWKDAVDTFVDPETSAEQCELHLRQVVELAEHRGHEWRQRGRNLADVLSDDRRVLARFGHCPTPSLEEEDRLAGLAVDRRLEICQQVLSEPPLVDDVAVWMVVDNASIADGYLRVGPVQLFDQSYWPAALQPGAIFERSHGLMPPPEIQDWQEAEGWFSHLPEADHRLFVRVWMEKTPVGKARQRARRAFRALIDLARSESIWILLDGEVAWRKEGGWSGSTFGRPVTEAERTAPPHPVFEGTADGLRAFDDQFVDRLIAGETIASSAVEDALWSVVVDRAPGPAQRIVLAARALERTLSPATAEEDGSWTAPAERYLEAPWVEWIFLNELLDGGAAAVQGLAQRRVIYSELYERAHDLIFPPPERFFNERGLAEVADEVLLAIGEGHMEHRVMREASSYLTDARAAANRISQLRRRFRALRDRAERQRNAIIHGSGSFEPAMSSVDSFMTSLVRIVARETMHQGESGELPLVELERKRVEWLELESELGDGKTWLDLKHPI